MSTECLQKITINLNAITHQILDPIRHGESVTRMHTEQVPCQGQGQAQRQGQGRLFTHGTRQNPISWSIESGRVRIIDLDADIKIYIYDQI